MTTAAKSSTTGHGVPSGYNIRNYPDQNPGHVEKATGENPTGPAQYSIKGWDAFWTLHGGMAVIKQSNTSLKVLANTSLSSDYYLRCSLYPHDLNTGNSSLPNTDTTIVDSGASGIYLTPSTHCIETNMAAPPINVGTAAGTHYNSTASCNLQLPTLPVRGGHIIPGLQHNLVGIGPLYDHGCKVIYNKHAVHVLDETSKVILQGCREPTGACLWRFSLQPGRHHHTPNRSPPAPTPTPTTLTANNAYGIPSVKAIVRFLQSAAGFPVKSTWLDAIGSGNYATWPGLTYENAKTYHPTTTEKLKVHMTQTRQGLRSNKRKTTPSNPTQEVYPISSDIPATIPNKLFIVVKPVSKIYTDDMGRFPIPSRSGHLYIMLTFHCDSNSILIEPFQYPHDRHCIASYSRIMTRLRERGPRWTFIYLTTKQARNTAKPLHKHGKRLSN